MLNIKRCFGIILSLSLVFSCAMLRPVHAESFSSDSAQQIDDEFFMNAQVVSSDRTGVTLKQTKILPQRTRSGNREQVETTMLKCVPNSEENAEELMALAEQARTARSQSNYRDMAEKSGAGTLYSTVYFERYYDYNSGRERAYLVHATGGYSQSDSTVTWYKNTIGLAQEGKYPGGSGLGQNREYDLTTTRTFDSYPTSGWQDIFTDTGSILLGVELTTTCTRGSSRWTTSLENWAIKS